MPARDITYYEKNGAVFRKVESDLGGGVRTVTSDIEVHPDVNEFCREHEDIRVRGYHSTSASEKEVPSPSQIPVREFEDYLATVDSVDVLLRMRKLDDRSTTEPMYEERIAELLGVDNESDDAEEPAPEGDENEGDEE